MFEYKNAIGQDSHRFLTKDEWEQEKESVLILAGCPFPGELPFSANSDGDVFLHALTNAISGITGRNILGGIADVLCLEQGIKDSKVYLQEALLDLKEWEITHISFTAEAKKPKLFSHIPSMRESVASILQIPASAVGITATSGEGLSDFGRGLGMMVFCSITVRRALP